MKKQNNVLAIGVAVSLILVAVIATSNVIIAATSSGNDDVIIPSYAAPVITTASDIETSDPIIIRGNAQAAVVASSGSGTPEDPYIIENIAIQLDSAIQDYMWIVLLGVRKYWFSPIISMHDLTVSVLVRNIVATCPEGVSGTAFVVDNCVDVDYANIVTQGPVVTAFYVRGDYTDPVNPVVKGDVSITGFSVEGFLSDAEGAIVFDHVNSASLVNGTIGNIYGTGLRRGTAIHTVMNFYMSGVDFVGCPFHMDIPPNPAWYVIDGTNTVDSLPILFYNMQSGFTVGPADNPGQVVVVTCTDFEIADLSMLASGYHAILYECYGGWLHDIEMANSRYDAVFMVSCGDMLIENCIIHDNARGGILTGFGDMAAAPNVIRNNIIYNNGRNIRPLLSWNMEIYGNEIFFSEEMIDANLPWPPELPEPVVYGIQMMGSHDISIHDNHIYNVNLGIDQETFYGGGTADNIEIVDNVIDMAYLGEVVDFTILTHGISSSMQGNNWIVTGNVITGYDAPLGMSGDGCTVTGNTFTSGPDTSQVLVNGIGTTVSRNNFINCHGDGNVAWDDGILGNYWSDYETLYPGAMNDGITWDTPYVINEWVYPPLSDDHPLVHPYNGNDETATLETILIAIASLQDLVDLTVTGGNNIACNNQLSLIDGYLASLIDDLVSGMHLDSHAVKMIGTKLHVIERVAKVQAVVEACETILIMVSML